MSSHLSLHMRFLAVSAFALVLSLAPQSFATDYYVDSRAGNDEASGLSPKLAWKTLDRVADAQELQPGDVVKFKSGEVWRGGLTPRSGAPGKPITYTSYGEGSKPGFWRSVSLAEEKAWVKTGENLWATRTASVEVVGDAGDFLGGNEWGLHQESGAKVDYSIKELPNGKKTYLFKCENCGTASNHIQWIKAPFKIEKGRQYRMAMDVRASEPITIKATLMAASKPWDVYGPVILGSIEGKTVVSRQEIVFEASKTASDARVTVSLGALPNGVEIEITNVEVDEVNVDSLQLGPDVGNIILDGKKAAFKRWTLNDLKAQDDFCYERGEGRVWFYSKENPAKIYNSIEAAVMRHVVNHSNLHDAIFDGLDIRYGSAHGFGGTNCSRTIVRNCDVSWIGGGDQYLEGGNGRRVRFGNGLEYWSDAEDNLVENCRFWEIYDAAITNQGAGTNVEKNIVYRNNLIWNCEYSFEYWNRDASSVTASIAFIDNVCLNAGYGWGHEQRPDKNGRCLMFYSNTAQTTNFIVKGNVFANATESLVRSDVEWKPEEPRLLENVYWQSVKERPLINWRNKNVFENEFDAWRDASGQEKNAKVEKVDVDALIPSVQ